MAYYAAYCRGLFFINEKLMIKRFMKIIDAIMIIHSLLSQFFLFSQINL